ncbi:MAG: hypothetical protein ACRETH_14375 [Steroidobacteraceae bacterium]
MGPATTTLAAVAPHLIGQTVHVWGWNTANPYIDGNGNKPGLDLGTYVVDGSGTVNNLVFAGAAYAVTNAVVGLGYLARWQSMMQAFAAALGTPLNQQKRIHKLGLILENTHAQGIQIGTDFEHLDDLPQSDLPMVPSTGDLSAGTAAPDLNAILNVFNKPMSAANDIWSTDSRVCLQAASPRPATAVAFTVAMDTSG